MQEEKYLTMKVLALIATYLAKIDNAEEAYFKGAEEEVLRWNAREEEGRLRFTGAEVFGCINKKK